MVHIHMSKKAYDWAKALCYYAGKDEAFLEQFWKALTQSEGVYQEFVYYLEHQNFLCSYQIQGYSLVDIMVWQIDHFKAEMDRRDPGMGQNGDKMVLLAFDTLLKMRKNPGKYVRALQGETGTDYPEKF